MITEAQILTIDYTTNSGTVRIPLFETVATSMPQALPATFAILPGIYNGYKVNDLVWVAFENGRPGNPIVIGKIFQNIDTESKFLGGTVISDNFKATASAELPYNTNIIGVKKDYNSITKIVSSIQQLEQVLLNKYQISFKITKENNQIGTENEIFIWLNTTNKYLDIEQLKTRLVSEGFVGTPGTAEIIFKTINSTNNTVAGIYVNTVDNTLHTYPEDVTSIFKKVTDFKCYNIANI